MWDHVVMCTMFLYCVVTVLASGKTPYAIRFGARFLGPLTPFGASVKYFPICDKGKKKGHQFEDKLREGIFMGYSQQYGGGWSGDLLWLDSEEIEASETPAEL